MTPRVPHYSYNIENRLETGYRIELEHRSQALQNN